MSRAPARAKPFKEPVVVCEGGPRNRRWYTLAGWQQIVRSSQWKIEHSPADTDHTVAEREVLAYRLTEQIRLHPDGLNTGRVLAYSLRAVPAR